jgi:hypothetical protein
MTKLQRLEQRARDLQSKMDRIENAWEIEVEKMKKKGTWKKYCEESGLVPHYTFRDLLC